MEAAILEARQREVRPVYEYTLPEGIAGVDELVKKSIGLVKLKMSEENLASDRAGQSATKLAYNLLRISLVEVDGRRISKPDMEDERILENCDPAIRSLMLEAYADMSTAENQVAKKFLGSRKIKV